MFIFVFGCSTVLKRQTPHHEQVCHHRLLDFPSFTARQSALLATNLISLSGFRMNFEEMLISATVQDQTLTLELFSAHTDIKDGQVNLPDAMRFLSKA